MGQYSSGNRSPIFNRRFGRMKKILLYMFSCLLILSILASCTEDRPTKPQNDPTVCQTKPTETIPELELPEKVPMPVVDREKTGALIEYDPNRELYIMTGYNDCVFYLQLSSDSCYGFYIFSKNPLDVSSISVDIPVVHPYVVSVKEIEMKGVASPDDNSSNYEINQFPYELYQCYQGKDFHKMAELRWELEYRRLFNSSRKWWLDEKLITQEQADAIHAQFSVANTAFESYRDAELEAYYSLKKENLPQFYVYYVTAYFQVFDIDHIPDETFTELTVTIGDQIYQQQVGQITLKSGNLAVFDQRDWVNDGYNADDGIIGYGDYPLPYNDGTNTINTYFYIEKVDRYKTLTRLVLDNPNQKLEAVWIQLKTQDGTISTYKWDMTEPFELYPGDEAVIYITYHDAYMDDHYLCYRTKVYGYLEYETDGKTWYKIAECSVDNTMNLYLLYAIIFDGLDVESYYWEYYYLFAEPWNIDSEICPYNGSLKVWAE